MPDSTSVDLSSEPDHALLHRWQGEDLWRFLAALDEARPGLPLLGVQTQDGALLHAGIALPDGRVIDPRGVLDRADFLAPWRATGAGLVDLPSALIADRLGEDLTDPRRRRTCLEQARKFARAGHTRLLRTLTRQAQARADDDAR